MYHAGVWHLHIRQAQMVKEGAPDHNQGGAHQDIQQAHLHTLILMTVSDHRVWIKSTCRLLNRSMHIKDRKPQDQ